MKIVDRGAGRVTKSITKGSTTRFQSEKVQRKGSSMQSKWYSYLIVVLCYLATVFFGQSFTLGGEISDSKNSVAKVLRATDIFGIDSVGNNIWAVGIHGSVFHSSDLGKTWKLQDTGTKGDLFSVCFVDSNEGWVVGYSGLILHTSDGGGHWAVQQREVAETKANLYKVGFVSKDKGWAVGEWSTILYTEDGGKTWVNQFPKQDKFFWGVSIVDSTFGWVVGEAGIIAGTTDGGKTWANQKSPGGEISLFGVYFKDPKRGWACGMDGLVILTRDGGKTWQRAETNTHAHLYSIKEAGNKLWAVGRNGVILCSLDEGLAWRKSEKTPVIYSWLIDIVYRDDNLILAGANGAVLVGKNGGETWR